MGSLSLFASSDYSREGQKATPFEGGSAKRSRNFTVGTDYRFGPRGLIGVAVRYGDTSCNVATGGDIDASSQGGAVYGSCLPIDGFFVDAAIGGNRERTDTRRNVSLAFSRAKVMNGGFSVLYEDAFVPLAVSESSTRATQTHAELRTGFDFSNGGFTYGSRIAAIWRRTEVDA